MNSFVLPSFAKINLGLRVLGKRDDGFHELFTVFQTISLHDTISFAPSGQIGLTCNRPFIPTGGRNLMVRAAKLLQERTGSRRGARMHLVKRIPSPGGLGGGSSNAAATLIGLNRLWEVDLPTEELHEMAEELGSDVPFFLYGGTALGTGRGTEIEPVDDIMGRHLIVVTPRIRVSTPKAFAALNAQSLTSADAERILIVCRLEAEKLDPQHSVLRNDIEAAVFAEYPEVGEVKRALLELGASNALMSGSGASVFAVFDNEETRQTALKALDKEVNWRKFAVAAVSRSEFRGAVFGKP